MNFFTKYDKRYTIELQSTHPYRGCIVIYLDDERSTEGTDYFLTNLFIKGHIIKEIMIYQIENKGDYYNYEELAKRINLKIKDIKTLEKTLDKMMGDLLLKEV